MKRLYRSIKNRSVAGVIGGLGEYFGIDPMIIRVAVVVISVMGALPLVVLIYIGLAILIPSAPLPAGYQTVNGEAEKVFEVRVERGTTSDNSGESTVSEADSDTKEKVFEVRIERGTESDNNEADTDTATDLDSESDSDSESGMTLEIHFHDDKTAESSGDHTESNSEDPVA